LRVRCKLKMNKAKSKKKLAIGTVRTWKDGKSYVKIGEGKWVRNYGKGANASSIKAWKKGYWGGYEKQGKK